MKKLALILLVTLACSCQTYRTITPTISASPRTEYKLEKPIIIAFKDSRQTVKNNAPIIDSLKADLKRIYGDNIVFASFYDKTDNGRVAIKIDIKEIGSTFGTRVIKYQSYYNQVTAVSSSISTYWGSSVSSVIVSQPVIRNNYSAQGYWVGTSYLNVTLVDKLHKGDDIYDFPFVGEDMQSNTWGYKSAKTAAEKSWSKVSIHLLELIDSISLKLIESE